MSGVTSRHEARIRQIEADIAAVRDQLVIGELDESTASRLTAGYERELASVSAAPEIVAVTRRPSSRRVAGALLLAGAVIVVSILAYAAIRPRDNGFITGGSTEGIDLETVTNDQMEAVIAANEGVVEVAAMRVALADRYFDETNFQSALPHYLAALEGQLDAGRAARALARIGWMTFVTGVPEVAEEYLQLALDTDPGYDEAHLFLGLLRLDGCDPRGALVELEPLLAIEGVPDDVRTDIGEAIDRARDLIAAESCSS